MERFMSTAWLALSMSGGRACTRDVEGAFTQRGDFDLRGLRPVCLIDENQGATVQFFIGRDDLLCSGRSRWHMPPR
ncbi:hypothetical protein [Paraburkholderia largidicola]|jgi:hypothetical protein|nr:hypothetical protein [Paraburkholderia sp. PGU16]